MYEYELQCPVCNKSGCVVVICEPDGHKWDTDLFTECGCKLDENQWFELEREARMLADMDREAAMDVWSEIRADR